MMLMISRVVLISLPKAEERVEVKEQVRVKVTVTAKTIVKYDIAFVFRSDGSEVQMVTRVRPRCDQGRFATTKFSKQPGKSDVYSNAVPCIAAADWIFVGERFDK